MLKRFHVALILLTLSTGSPFPTATLATTVNDITQLNPIVVERVVVPRTVEEIRQLVQDYHGPISIGGGRYSMGGQIATEHTLHLDTRALNRIIALSLSERTITVEAGITWRKIQEAIDPHNLSLKIKQTYSNFTVGGSLSVNAHGRYVGQGPLIGSVQSIKVVLASGELVEASPSQNSELFYGCIGGYGGLGIIVEATLDLVENQKVERTVQKLAVGEYKDFFLQNIKSSHTAVFHNGDLYPPAYDFVRAITWSVTDRPVIISDRLMPVKQRYWTDTLAYFLDSESPVDQTGTQKHQGAVSTHFLHYSEEALSLFNKAPSRQHTLGLLSQSHLLPPRDFWLTGGRYVIPDVLLPPLLLQQSSVSLRAPPSLSS